MRLMPSMHPEHLPPGLAFLKAHFLLHRALTARVGMRLEREQGIEVRDLIALSFIAWGGVNTPTELARELQLPKYEVSRSLERLVALGAVTRTLDPVDARRTRVHLTESGREFHERSIAAVQETVGPALESFPKMQELLGGLERLAASLSGQPAEVRA